MPVRSQLVLGIFSTASPTRPAAPVKLIGVLRLRSFFASRRSYSAQDDSCYTFLYPRCARLTLLAIVISMSTLTLPQNPARAPGDHRSQADHQQAQRECRTEPAEPFDRKALHDALGGSHDLVARWQDHRFRFEHQRPQQYLAGASRRRMAHAAYGQRPAPDPAHVVARRQVDRLHLRLRRRRAVGHFLRLAQDRTGHQHHQHARNLRRESDLVARRPLSRLHGEAQDIVGVRN